MYREKWRSVFERMYREWIQQRMFYKKINERKQRCLIERTQDNTVFISAAEIDKLLQPASTLFRDSALTNVDAIVWQKEEKKHDEIPYSFIVDRFYLLPQQLINKFPNEITE